MLEGDLVLLPPGPDEPAVVTHAGAAGPQVLRVEADRLPAGAALPAVGGRHHLGPLHPLGPHPGVDEPPAHDVQGLGGEGRPVVPGRRQADGADVAAVEDQPRGQLDQGQVVGQGGRVEVGVREEALGRAPLQTRVRVGVAEAQADRLGPGEAVGGRQDPLLLDDGATARTTSVYEKPRKGLLHILRLERNIQ